MDTHHRSLKWFAGQSNKLKVPNCQNRYKYVKVNSSLFWRPLSSPLKWDKYTCSSLTSAHVFKHSPSSIYSRFNGSQTYNTKFGRNRSYNYIRKSDHGNGNQQFLTPVPDFSQHQDKVFSSEISSGVISRVQENNVRLPPSSSNVLHTKTSRFRYVKPGSSASSRLASKNNLQLVTKFSIKKINRLNISRPSAYQYKRIVQKAVHSLKFRRRMVCQSYCRTGFCSAQQCSYSHDENYLRICPRFLQQSCSLGSESCPLAHVLDPCRLPQCTYYESGKCERLHCPYLHVRHPPKTAVCPDFSRGRCPLGRLCIKRHIWVQKSFSNKSGHQKLSKLTTVSKNACRNLITKLQDTCDHNDFGPVAAPAGSLRNVYPPPEFIPLISDNDDSMTGADANCS
ncbi:unnamed protein product [Schistosoma margrebowiei]|uniref:Uncharacterized protein n=2 Tax=Schistosoma margrebowiei TaxID=48269 RepID=A0A183LIE5_9TREM|nr:unnamed protein product [Schistosoma margrebowiei]